jgi:hypothetical protein
LLQYLTSLWQVERHGTALLLYAVLKESLGMLPPHGKEQLEHAQSFHAIVGSADIKETANIPKKIKIPGIILFLITIFFQSKKQTL